MMVILKAILASPKVKMAVLGLILVILGVVFGVDIPSP